MLSAELNVLLACSHGIPHKTLRGKDCCFFLLFIDGETEAQTVRRSPSPEMVGQTFDLLAQIPPSFLIQSLETIHSPYKHFPVLG